MSVTVHFLGWCHRPEKNNDKIWGYIETDTGSIYNFWGRRGKTLSFKRWYGRWEKYTLEDIGYDKQRKKGYVEIAQPKYDTVWPDLIDYLKTEFVAAKFSGKIKNDDLESESFI
jgi:hypothetical protein